jgi:DNA repair protein RadD
MHELTDDQTSALDRLRESVGAGHRRIVMQAPTGFGKTVLAAAVVENARKKDKRVLYTVPSLSLIDQTMEMFYENGVEDVGVIQADNVRTDWSRPVQIASVQTLMRRPMPECDVVLIDECHVFFTFYKKWLDQTIGWQCPVIGLSATPWTRGLGAYYRGPFKKPANEQETCLIVASSTGELIQQGRLSPFKVYAPTHPDLTGVRTVAGDYHEGELSERMRDGRLVADAVDTWIRLGENRATLCYAVDTLHAKHLQEKFLAAGVPCGYQDAKTKDADRKRLKEAFHESEVKVVVSVGTMTTGIDWDVRCISMCRPTKSDMLFVQIVGRGLRVAEGKDHCLILDHSDNHNRLGFVTDIDVSYTGLSGGKEPQHDNRVSSIPLPKECPQCTYLRPPGTNKCPACGFEAQAKTKVKPEEGELRELKRAPKPKKLKLEPEEKAAFYGELKAFAKARGFNPHWADNKYRDRLGVWPNAYKHVPLAARVSDATMEWIRDQQRAFAQSKRERKERSDELFK